MRPSSGSSSRKSYSGSGWNSLGLRCELNTAFFAPALGLRLAKSAALGTFKPISTATLSPRLNSTSSAQSTVPTCSPASHAAVFSSIGRPKNLRTRSPLQLVPALLGRCVLEPNSGPTRAGRLGLRVSAYGGLARGGRYPSSVRLSPGPRSRPLLSDPRSPRLPPAPRSTLLALGSGRLRSRRLPPQGRRKSVSSDRFTLRLREVGARLGADGDIGWRLGGLVDVQSRSVAAASLYEYIMRENDSGEAVLVTHTWPKFSASISGVTPCLSVFSISAPQRNKSVKTST